MVTSRISGALAALLCLGLGSVASADGPRINWQRNLATAQGLARQDKKLVLDFLLIGNLNASDC